MLYYYPELKLLLETFKLFCGTVAADYFSPNKKTLPEWHML
jgi:hypothetical protein